MDKISRRTFIASGTLATAGALLPPSRVMAAPTGIWTELKSLHESGELGEVRRCHFQCLRVDAPEMRDAIEGLQQTLDLSVPKKISACGEYAVPNVQPSHFLVNLDFDPGPTVVLTSTTMEGSWGVIRGEKADVELFEDRLSVRDRRGDVTERPVANTALPRTQASLTVLNLALDALNQAVTIYPNA